MEQKEMKKYLRAVCRKLNMPKEMKDRVITDLISSIEARTENGQSPKDILAELGAPEAVAAELNEQMKEYTYRKSPWRWACLAIAIVSVLSLIHGGVRGLLAAALTRAEAASVGIIGGADGPTAIFVTTSAASLRYIYGTSVLILVMSILGFFALRKMKQK